VIVSSVPDRYQRLDALWQKISLLPER